MVTSSQQVIVVRKIKLDGVVSEHRALLVEARPEGCWLYSPAGTTVTKSDGTSIAQPADGVQFFPVDQWFAAWCWAPAINPSSSYWTRPWISVDIAEPAQVDLVAGRATFVDLELDLWCSEEGSGVVDQDELEAAERQGLLTSSKATTARRTAEELHADLKAGCATAFDGVGWRLLERATNDLSGI